MKRKIAMIGNAHLDPSWMWSWQEGSCEAKATIRSALDRMNEYDDFKFVCAGASVYRWIEEFDPLMFEEIKQRVSEGRFIVVGGWNVQPDCNLPSGEGFARQALYSQRYFKEKLGVTAKTGYCVDSFGHNANLPQILSKSGMKNYIFMRPSKVEMPNENSLFYWSTPDGSKVLTYRIPIEYEYRFSDMNELQTAINNTGEQVCENDYMIFYGVGNHGGGPTKRNIELIHEHSSENEEIYLADLDNVFEEYAKSKDIPEYSGELQHHASGAYSAVSEIKTAVRIGEWSLIAAEGLAVMANALCGKNYDTCGFENAWNNVTFSHFHDILGGCCTRAAYREALPLCYEAISYAKKSINNSVQTISWAVDTSDAPTIPVIVFNPHPFSVRTTVRVNGSFERATDFEGNEVPTQKILSEADACFGRRDTLLLAEIPALGYMTYYMFSERADTTLVSHAMRVWLGDVKSQNSIPNPEGELRVGRNFLENKYIKVTFDEKDASVCSYYDKRTGREILSNGGISAIVIDEDKHDTWSHEKNHFDRVIGKFSDGAITVLEEGPVRVSLKLVSRYNESVLTQRFYLEEDSEELQMSCELLWLEKHKMLKLAVNTTLTDCIADYQIPFGSIARPMNGEEESGHTWTALEGKEGALAMFNNCKYSSSASGSTMYLTAIRSPIYGDHGRSRTTESIYTDQGFTEFSYAFKFYPEVDRADMTRRAAILNFAPVCVIENMHKGTLPKRMAGIGGDTGDIIITAIKRSEDGDGTVIRAYNSLSVPSSATIEAPFKSGTVKAEFSPCEVKTLLKKDDSDIFREILMTEYDI